MKITTKDLARMCGVSVTTIHRALHGTGRISAETRGMILDMAEKYGYRPDPLARGLVGGRTNHIGIVVPDVENRYFSQMLNAAETHARRMGYSVNIMLHERSGKLERELLSELVDYHVDGILLSSVNSGTAYHSFLQSLKVPVVTVDNKIDDGLPFVGIDQRAAAAAAAGRLAGRNYENIIFICPPLADREHENVYVHEEREKGFWDVMNGYPDKRGKVLAEADFVPPAFALLQGCSGKTAFFCTGDMIALALIHGLEQRGKHVIQDYGIMGFDHIDILKYLSPGLATIDNAVEEVARAAVDMLYCLIEDKETQKVRILEFGEVEGETM